MKKEIRDWAILLSVVGLLYVTGWHTEVVGLLQRVVLSTGLIQAEQLPKEEQSTADYQFRLIDQEGMLVDFAQFRGQTIFLNFWATWCPPCIAEMPDIHDLYEKVKDEPIAFVLISQDKNFETAKNFIDRKGFNFPIYQLASPLPAVFASQSIPTTFVIAPSGKIIAKRTGMAKYDTDAFRALLTGSE